MKPRLYISFILVLATLGSCKNSGVNSSQDPLSVWLKNNSHEIEALELSDQQKDIEPLGQIVGDAKVVCLGESRHDIREQFKLKGRFIKYLVEEKDFSVFILEASLPYAELINAYLFNGEEDIDELLANMPGWFLWDTEEILEIFNWMRDYNMDTENVRKLRFYGIDIVAPSYALSSSLEYLKRVDKKVYEDLQALDYAQDQIDDNFWQSTYQRFAEFSTGKKETLRTNYRRLYQQILDNKSAFIAYSGDEEYNWILRQAYCANQACIMFTAGSRMEMGLIRDSAMADNALWVHRNITKGEKAIIWAHNVHITRGEFTMTGESASIKGMGYILGQELKSDLVSIGASFNQGEFEDWGLSFGPAEAKTMDGVFTDIGMEYALINLRKETKNEEVERWMNSDQILQGQEFEMTCIPGSSFDAIFFVNKISRTAPNPGSLERFRNMN